MMLSPLYARQSVLDIPIVVHYDSHMIARNEYILRIKHALENSPVAALLGPRQCGKTTLARIVADEVNGQYFDLENPQDKSHLSNPMLRLKDAEGLVVLDEIQRDPSLFDVLRVLVDRPDCKARYLVLGSASPHLVKGASESLAGRISFIDLSGFNLTEVGSSSYRSLWLRGGFPRSFLASSDKTSVEWRDNFIRTFLERDIPQLGITVPADTLRRFWTMVAHYHGQVWNAAEFARSLGTAEATARRYLDIMSGAYMVKQLHPWYENLKKRQVKSPKIYIRDSGILHALLGLPDEHALGGHPKLGASWEGFIIEQIITRLNTRDAYFWATHTGAELDLLIMRRGKRFGLEIKYTDAPRTSKSMRSSLKDLRLDMLYVVYPGTDTYPLDDCITALAVNELDILG